MKKNAYINFIFLCSFMVFGVMSLTAQTPDLDLYVKDHEIKLVKDRKRELVLLPPGENTIKVSDLIVGEQYLLAFNKDDFNNYCSPEYRLINGVQDSLLSSESMDFIAKSKTIYLKVKTNCKADYNTRLAMYVTVARRGNFVDFMTGDLYSTETIFGQLHRG